MTRETKIGLLVGLAFIIVIGILLSDYNRNESQNAPLTAVASDVQKGAVTPRSGSGEIAVVPPAPTPSRPVPTRDELHRPAAIDVAPRTPAVAAGHDASHTAPTHSPVGPTDAGADPEETTAGADNPSNLPAGLRHLVDEHQNELTAGNPPAHPDAPHTPEAPTVNGARQYVAISGDTVSKLAGRFLGANTKANREAIMAINPALKSNPNNVTVGRTYMIPAKGAAPAAPVAAAIPGPVHPIAVAAAPTPAPSAEQHYFYTVKENDNLWKIAAEQLGDGSAWAAIKDLNKDVLKGGEVVRPNMRLRMPAKPVASAN